MRPSRYNIFTKVAQGPWLAFNSASAALAEIEPEQIALVRALLEDQAPAEPPAAGDAPGPDAAAEILRHLQLGGYLVDDAVDELRRLKVLNRRSRFGGTSLSLTIAPTLACNLACTYCFEEHRAQHMSEATVEAVERFAAARLRHLDTLAIVYFGGEPTLRLATVLELERRLRAACTATGVEMKPSAMITNGVLLDGDMAAQLAEAGVSQVQVTLDGPAEVHDRRRLMPGGRPTFERILRNLDQAASRLDVIIRVNVDQDNPEAALALPEILDAHGLLDRVRLYLAPVRAVVDPSAGSPSTACADARDRCLADEDVAQLQVDLYSRMVEAGFTAIQYPELAPGGHCAADSTTGFVIAPDGTLLKCWEELGSDHGAAVGSVHAADPLEPDNGDPVQQANHERYLAWDPFELPGCRDCHVLPLCMGGCPRRNMAAPQGSDRGTCTTWRFNLEQMLHLRYRCEQRTARP